MPVFSAVGIDDVALHSEGIFVASMLVVEAVWTADAAAWQKLGPGIKLKLFMALATPVYPLLLTNCWQPEATSSNSVLKVDVAQIPMDMLLKHAHEACATVPASP